MKNIALSLFLLLYSQVMSAQEANTPIVQAGLEIDALPYLTGGYFVAAWVGKGHWRARILHASVYKPDWTTTKGFTHHHIKASAALIDFFPKQKWRSWWIGAGAVHWRSDIQSKASLQKAYFENILLNGSLGYNLSLGKNIYLSPWAGLSIKVTGDKDVPVDQVLYTLPVFNPEASVKLGFNF